MMFQFQLAGFNLRKSRMSLMIVSRASALPRTPSTYSRCSSVRSVSKSNAIHADDAVHRGADLMAHVREERGLGERGVLQLLVERDELGVAVDELLLAFPQRAIGGIAL